VDTQSIPVPTAVIEAIAERAAELMATRQARWVYGDKAAAQYLGFPVGRVTKLRQAGTSVRRLRARENTKPGPLNSARPNLVHTTR